MRIRWTPAARDDVRTLDARMQDRVRRGVRRFAEVGQGDVKKLVGTRDEWRLRVGDWRVRFTRDADTLIIKRVQHRREAYRD